MVAGALHELGIHMGTRRDGIVFEDVELVAAVESDDPGALPAFVEQRDAAYALWGWKRPDLITRLPAIKGVFRNPCYVAVFRDLLAIATRNRISMSIDSMASIRLAQQRYAQVIEFLAGSTAPRMLISYEKALLQPRTVIRELAGFVGVETTDAIERAVEFVQADRPAYLHAARSRQVIGIVDRVGSRLVTGWAKPASGVESVTLTLLVDGRPVMDTVANLARGAARLDRLRIVGGTGERPGGVGASAVPAHRDA